MYQIKTTPYLNNNNEYINIVVISPPPVGKLKEITKQIRQPIVSPFQTPNACSNLCINVILNPNNKNKLLCLNEIEYFYEFLYNNGYNINYKFTKTIRDSKLFSQSEILFYINKN